jgi:hypothetical protein
MNPELDKWIEKLGDSAIEKEVVRTLLALPEDARLAFVERLATSNDAKIFRAAFRLAKATLKDSNSLLEFLKFGSEKSDASTIKYWLDTVAPNLGFRRIVRFFKDRLNSDPKSTIIARYWLPTLFPPDNDACLQELNSLDNMITAQIKGDVALEERFAAVKAKP